MSDLPTLLELQAHLAARPIADYLDRHGQPCRHPGGLYAQSLGKVLSRMASLTETIQPYSSPDNRHKAWEVTLRAVESLLLAVDSHADDLRTILGCCTAGLSSKTLKRLGDQIDGIVEELAGRPINRVKHNGERLEACFCSNQRFAVYGYYVAGVRSGGVVGASELAHGSSGKQWSVPVTIRRLLGQLIQAARVVLSQVRSPIALTRTSWQEQQRSDLHAIAAWLQICPAFCFPNETNVLVPDVGLIGDEPYLRLSTLKRLRSVHTQPNLRWTRQFTGDGVSTQFKVD